jgi:hypothetical protein
VYGRLVRAAGWTLEYIDQMSVARAFEMLDYLNEYPLPDEILAAVHLKKREKSQAAPRSPKDALAQMQSMAGELGPGLKGQAVKMPPHLKAMLDQALAMQAKLNRSLTTVQ